ncbi:hypothetical protein BDN72DRAFT_883900 [Pluteus cervinus]|uniref:Uncharacterized protein n=1 Tax=Pluteus cervinus TaxID=181527 RepID=A0ACD3A1B6_9AGAR|nr:hypothetical protein BDN72DRAFT_883900 [Pluteus cervinus]
MILGAGFSTISPGQYEPHVRADLTGLSAVHRECRPLGMTIREDRKADACGLLPGSSRFIGLRTCGFLDLEGEGELAMWAKAGLWQARRAARWLVIALVTKGGGRDDDEAFCGLERADGLHLHLAAWLILLWTKQGELRDWVKREGKVVGGRSVWFAGGGQVQSNDIHSFTKTMGVTWNNLVSSSSQKLEVNGVQYEGIKGPHNALIQAANISTP